MSAGELAACQTCGAPFRRSRAGYTVNCPEHRGRRASAASPAAAQVETCRCGKTVIAGPGVPAGTTCPRSCS